MAACKSIPYAIDVIGLSVEAVLAVTACRPPQRPAKALMLMAYLVVFSPDRFTDRALLERFNAGIMPRCPCNRLLRRDCASARERKPTKR